ncbi:NAD-dependent epimerase/dehydratase family protein [Laribacter hongkongensis]|nr:NAD-dependent epimerase/dehydratase family protein [Laribacter hongkongensis]MCG9073768.1 NAD-dependent epimerase/dehydratase family protein [Laribacter hongkongensis]
MKPDCAPAATGGSRPVTVLGAGFIGRNFIAAALRQGWSIRVLDHNPCPPELKDQLDWIQGDMGSRADVYAALNGVSTVFHFVSSTVPGDEVDESHELQQNVFQTLQLLKLCVQEKVQRIVFASSSSVYGLQEQLPVSESASTDPISSYGIHKLAIEKYLRLYQYQHGLDCKIARLSNPYGPGQSIDGRQGFVAIAIGCILRGEPIAVRGDGEIIRDFVYIDDVVDALLALAVSDSREALFNIGSGMGYSLNEVIARLRALCAIPVEASYAESRFVDIPKSVLDVCRERYVLRKTSKISLECGLAMTLAHHHLPLTPLGTRSLNEV